MRRVKQLPAFIKRAPKEGPRVLVADIETLPIEAYVWACFKQNVGVEQIKEPTRMMSFCGKWLDDDAYYFIDNPIEQPRNDFYSVVAAHHILNHTDYVVAHNGQQFDMRKLRAFMAMHGLDPLPVIPVIDTLQLNRKAFGFDSQRLAFVSKHFGATEKDKHTEFPGFTMWDEYLKGNPRAFAANHSYNRDDVLANEAMYKELRGWYQGAPNFGVFYPREEDEHRCPNCGSVHVQRQGTRRTQVGVYARYKCTDCGGWSRGRTLIVSKADRAHILMN